MSSVPPVAPMSAEQIECISEKVVRRISPATLTDCSPVPIETILETQLTALCGVSFCVEDMRPGDEGKFEGEELIIASAVYDAAHRGDGRARYTYAHEFGHCWLHKKQLQMINGRREPSRHLHRRDEIKPFRDPEWQANKFAASLLMPRVAVQQIAREQPHWTHELLGRRLASTFKVSQQAAQIRVAALQQKGGIRL